MTRAEAAAIAHRLRTERGTVMLVCPMCGTQFRAQKHVIARTKVKTCSRACRSKGMSGTRNVRWKGGRRIAWGKYIAVQTPEGYKLEHRVVMEQMIGRALLPTEIVHHRNEITTDNRPENLELCASRGRHALDHHLEQDPQTGRWRKRGDGRPM